MKLGPAHSPGSSPSTVFLTVSLGLFQPQVWVMREYLHKEFGGVDENLFATVPGGFDLERVIDDFVFMCFFVGEHSQIYKYIYIYIYAMWVQLLFPQNAPSRPRYVFGMWQRVTPLEGAHISRSCPFPCFRYRVGGVEVLWADSSSLHKRHPLVPFRFLLFKR